MSTRSAIGRYLPGKRPKNNVVFEEKAILVTEASISSVSLTENGFELDLIDTTSEKLPEDSFKAQYIHHDGDPCGVLNSLLKNYLSMGLDSIDKIIDRILAEPIGWSSFCDTDILLPPVWYMARIKDYNVRPFVFELFDLKTTDEYIEEFKVLYEQAKDKTHKYHEFYADTFEKFLENIAIIAPLTYSARGEKIETDIDYYLESFYDAQHSDIEYLYLYDKETHTIDAWSTGWSEKPCVRLHSVDLSEFDSFDNAFIALQKYEDAVKESDPEAYRSFTDRYGALQVWLSKGEEIWQERYFSTYRDHKPIYFISEWQNRLVVIMTRYIAMQELFIGDIKNYELEELKEDE